MSELTNDWLRTWADIFYERVSIIKQHTKNPYRLIPQIRLLLREAERLGYVKMSNN